MLNGRSNWGGGSWVSLRVALVVVTAAAAVAFVVTRLDVARAPATRESLAAVAVDVLDIEPSSYVPDLDLEYGIRVNWHPGGVRDAQALYLDIEPREDEGDPPCDGESVAESGDGCVTWEVDGGAVQLEWQDASFESDPGWVWLRLLTGDEVRSLRYHGAEIDGDPRESDNLPFAVSRLAEVVTDDRFASSTTREMANVDLEGWPTGWEDDDDTIATSSKGVAHWMEELGLGLFEQRDGTPPTVTPFAPSVYGEDAVGAHVQFDGWSASAVIVPTESAPTCGPGWHCTPARYRASEDWGVTTGWRRGRALVIKEMAGRVIVARVTSPIIDSRPRSLRDGARVPMGVGDAVDAFENYVGERWDLTTSQGVVDAYADLEPFQH